MKEKDYSKDSANHWLLGWFLGRIPKLCCEFYIFMIKVTISTVFNVLVVYKDTPLPKHPWFLKDPGIWSPNTGPAVRAIHVLKLTRYVKPETQTALIRGQIIFQFVLSLLNYSEKKWLFPPPLKVCSYWGYTHSFLCLLTADCGERRPHSSLAYRINSVRSLP